MKYQSSRGGVQGASFEDALFSGYAPDGGLYVPETLPVFPQDILTKWKASPPTYPEVVFEITKLFVGEDELPRDILQSCINKAYAQFDTAKVLELRPCKLSSDPGSGEYTVVELFHGKTKSFKDYALSLVGRLMEYYVQKRQSHVTIVVGTSGDTGSAAIEAVKGLQGIDIIVLYPKGKVSEVQELQMVTVTEDNVHVFETEGTSDDLDEPIKESFTNPQPGLISINSINWARIMIQISHYVYLSTLEHMALVDIYVPTGAAGNLSAGLVASLLGFPVNLYAATNLNDNVEVMINKGKLVLGGEVIETYANAMDIRNAYNTERLLYFMSNTKTVAAVMKSVEGQGGSVPDEIREKLKGHIKGAFKVDTPTTLETIRKCWEANNYVICPHTATAVAYFSKANTENGTTQNNKSYIIATASPEKFPDAAKAAQLPSIDCNKVGLLQELQARQKKQPKVMRKGENWFDILQAEINLTRNKYKA